MESSLIIDALGHAARKRRLLDPDQATRMVEVLRNRGLDSLERLRSWLAGSNGMSVALARELLRPVDDERLPELRLPTQPVRFGGAAPNLAGRAPALGEHTHDVLAALLDCGADRLAELQALGVFGHAIDKEPT